MTTLLEMFNPNPNPTPTPTPSPTPTPNQVPTAEETEMLAPYLSGAEPTAKLDGAEKFLLEMCKVRPGPRVGCKVYPRGVQGEPLP